MPLDKAIKGGKEHRKPYCGAKKFPLKVVEIMAGVHGAKKIVNINI